jgi:hypothetical protein
MVAKRINVKKKGNTFELKLAKEIAQKFDIEYGKYIRRTPGSGALLCRADLWIHESHRHKFPWFLEAKKRATATLDKCDSDNWEVYNWYKDAKDKVKDDPDYAANSPVLLVFAKNNVGPFVMMSSEDYAQYILVPAMSPNGRFINNRIAVGDHFYMVVPKYKMTIILWKDFITLVKPDPTWKSWYTDK